MGAAVLVPVKAFSRAKLRLAPALDAPARAELARRMAGHVVAIAWPLPVSVVCDDAEVAAWAVERGATVVWAPGRGLDAAVASGVSHVGGLGFSRVIVAHADLPLARSLEDLAAGEGVLLVPDRRDDGTNVAVVPANAGFRFAYGPGSFGRHRREAERLGLAVDVRRAPELAWDVDVPADLALPRHPLLPCR
ncbi:MAG: 2-phospho-L-lactate guanylyltransferase [Actinomycetota bacterium]|nr:2-phospho-L-lactate guanylyltransferase [Actinomycetota bacterium]